MKSRQRVSSARVLVTLSALSAIGIILGKYLAFNVTEFMRFSLENITIIFTGIVFGPLYGAVVGAVQDLVGCLAVGYAINPIITLGSAAVGAVSGGIWLVCKKLHPPVRIALSVSGAHLVGSVIIKSIGLAVFYSLPFVVTALWRLLNYVIVGCVEALLLYFLLKSKQLLAQINKIVPFSLGARFKSQDEATSYAKSISNVFSKPGLERIEALLASVGSPESNLKAVHVTGTNGKGSFVAMLTSVLTASGLRVGIFTSPYLTQMRESIRIGGEPISEEVFLSLFEKLRPIADSADDKPTEFELLTAAAYLAFYEAGVDVAVIECGMGARRDATNVISAPLLAVITGVSSDHTAYLGTSEGQIAEEKAGVIKNGCPVLIGNVTGEALAVIEAKAEELGARLYTPDTCEVKSLTLDGTVIFSEGIGDVDLPLLGVHQTRNAALAITAAKILRESFPVISEESIRVGISKAEWHGRFELLSDSPIFIFDGAHNPEGIRSAIESIKHYFDKKVICLTGVLRDKEYEAMADEIASVAAWAVTVTPNNARALSAEDYSIVLTMRGVKTEAASSVEEGVSKAVSLAKETDSPVVCLGSLYLYREVSAAVKNAVK